MSEVPEAKEVSGQRSPEKRRRYRTSTRVLGIVLPAVVLATLLESALRLFAPPDLTRRVGIVSDPGFRAWLAGLAMPGGDPDRLYLNDPTLLWRLVPGARVVGENPFHSPDRPATPISITINAQGYRGPTADAPDRVGRPVALCLGDSNFFGYPLDDAHAFPAALERALGEAKGAGSWTVVNGGTPGYSVVQGLRWYRRAFASLRPRVILLSFLNNDAWPQPSGDAEVLERAASPAGRLVRWLSRSRIVGLVQNLRPPPEPGRSPLVPRVPLALYRETHEALLDAARDVGARVVIVDFRAAPAYRPYSSALEQLAGARPGVTYVNVSRELDAAARAGAHLTGHDEARTIVEARWTDAWLSQMPYLLYYAEPEHPHHPSELGAEILAERLVPLVSGEPAAHPP